jgi:hypothetical protein
VPPRQRPLETVRGHVASAANIRKRIGGNGPTSAQAPTRALSTRSSTRVLDRAPGGRGASHPWAARERNSHAMRRASPKEERDSTTAPPEEHREEISASPSRGLAGAPPIARLLLVGALEPEPVLERQPGPGLKEERSRSDRGDERRARGSQPRRLPSPSSLLILSSSPCAYPSSSLSTPSYLLPLSPLPFSFPPPSLLVPPLPVPLVPFHPTSSFLLPLPRSTPWRRRDRRRGARTSANPRNASAGRRRSSVRSRRQGGPAREQQARALARSRLGPGS